MIVPIEMDSDVGAGFRPRAVSITRDGRTRFLTRAESLHDPDPLGPPLVGEFEPEPDLEESKGFTCILILTAFAICMSSFQYGWAIGVVNAPFKIITTWYNETYYKRYGVPMQPTHITLIWGITVAIFNVTGLLGGLLSGYFCDLLGRKKCLLVNNTFTFIAAIIFITAKTASSFEMIIIARLFIGFNCGITSGACAMYLAEISPINIRGAICSSHQIFLSLAILVSQIFGLHQILGTDDGWPFLFALAIVPAVVQTIILPFMPESPRYLLIYKEREKMARADLSRLRNTQDIHDEIEQMKIEYEDQKIAPVVTWADMITKPMYRRPLLIASQTHMSRQLSGITAVMSYSTSLFHKAGLSDQNARYASLALSVTYFIFCTLTSTLVDKAGRRTLYLAGLGGMWFASILITITLVLGSKSVHQWVLYLAIFFVFTYVAFCSIGPSVIAWFIASELFTQSARAKGNSLSVCFNWGSSFVIVLLFPIFLATLENYTFLVFTVILSIFWVGTFAYLPETRGKTSDEMARYFMSPSDKKLLHKLWQTRHLLHYRGHPHSHNHHHNTKF